VNISRAGLRHVSTVGRFIMWYPGQVNNLTPLLINFFIQGLGWQTLLRACSQIADNDWSTVFHIWKHSLLAPYLQLFQWHLWSYIGWCPSQLPKSSPEHSIWYVLISLICRSRLCSGQEMPFMVHFICHILCSLIGSFPFFLCVYSHERELGA